MKSLVNNLRVAALPMPIVWADKDANMHTVERALEQLPTGTDVLVLPELFSTGFADDFELMADLAERNTGTTVDTIRAWAARYGVAIAGSFVASTPPHLYNRGFFHRTIRRRNVLRQTSPFLCWQRRQDFPSRHDACPRSAFPRLEYRTCHLL